MFKRNKDVNKDYKETQILKKGGQIMNKNLFRKVVCLVLSLLMVMPVMPNNIYADTEQLNEISIIDGKTNVPTLDETLHKNTNSQKSDTVNLLEAVGGITTPSSINGELLEPSLLIESLTRDISVTKVWSGTGTKPQFVEIVLYENGVEATDREPLILSTSNNWTGSFKELPKYDVTSNVINYTIKETPVLNFISNITGDMESGYIVTNIDAPTGKLNIHFSEVFGVMNSITIKLIHDTGESFTATPTKDKWNSAPYGGYTLIITDNTGLEYELEAQYDQNGKTKYVDNNYFVTDPTAATIHFNYITLKPVAKAVVIKMDEDSNPLAGARFKVTLADGSIKYVTSDSYGYILNGEKIYKGTIITLQETVAPEGYIFDSTIYTINYPNYIDPPTVEKLRVEKNIINYPNIPSMSITKTATETTYDSVGDVIHYAITVANIGNTKLTGVSVIDELLSNELYSSGDINNNGELDINETWTYTGSYTITQDDLNKGEVYNIAVADSDQTDQISDDLTVTSVQNAELTLVKTAEPQTYAKVGDTINYSYSVINSGNVTLSGPFTVADDKVTVNTSTAPTTLEPGASFTVTATYTVKQADIDVGSVTNIAKATNGTVISNEDSVTVTVVKDASISIVKDGMFIDVKNVGFADVNEVINYTFTVTNTGNVTLYSIEVTDPLVKVIGSPIASLAPGETDSITFTASYVIKQADIDAGFVVNTATATALDPQEKPVSSSGSDTVLLTKGYVVIYNANGGSGTMIDINNPYDDGETVTVIANAFTRSGYRFVEWNTKADGSGTRYSGDEKLTFIMPDHDVTLYAQWSRRSDPPVIIIHDPDPPLADLEKFDHFAYVIGYPDGDVKPQNNITREEVAMIFYRLLTDESRNEWLSDANPFTDLENHEWSNRAISTLFNAGIIKGYPDGTFRPSDPITRAEFATIAAKFDKLELNSTSKFTDIFGHWAEKYITSSEIKGWIKGYPDLTFKPEQDITRAEAMTLINNVLERAVPEENIHPDAMFWPDMESNDWYYEAVMEATNSHNYIYEEDKDELWTGMKPNKVWP